MQLRRFIGENTPATLGAVRHAFGDNAIILANRRIGEQVEIIATGQLDESALASARLDTDDSSDSGDSGDTGDSGTQRSTQPEANNQATEMGDAANESSRNSEADGGTVLAIAENSSVLNAMDSSDVGKASQPITFDKVDIVNQTNAESTTDTDALESPAVTANQESLLGDVKAHIDDVSDRLEERFRCLEVNLWGSRNPKRSLLLRQLLSLGIGAELAIRLAERVPQGSGLDEAFRHTLAMLKDTLPVASDKLLLEPGVTALHGPEGSGKTTVLMKLATQYVKSSGNQSIVIICADTRRIGAYESLQVFGRLIGVPVVQAHENAELDSLLDAFEHKALVLVDHASLDLPAAILQSTLASNTPDDTTARSTRNVLVLSAVMQAATTEALLSKHEGSAFSHCVLTHLDTSARLGELFGALIRHHLPVLSWSDTAAVQVPMQKADASVLVATAVAMGKRLVRTPDEEWLMALIQPVGETAQHLSIPALPSLEETEPSC